MANEILKFLNGQSSNLASKTVQAGQVYFAINSDGETGSIYFDAPISSTVTKRIAMSGQSVEHANEADYATRDALGNIITDTYISQMRLDNSGTKIQYKYPGTQTWSELQPLFLPLAGGQITNDLGVNGTITAGNLIVNGAARFAQTILGNILSADKWSTARNFAISDHNASHTGTTVAVDGSAAVTLPLPDTITATLKGNADTATTSTNATNLQAYGSNEVTIGANSTTAGSSTNSTVWINYRDRSNGTTSNGATKITDYYFGNRKGAVTDVTVHATTFDGNASSANIWKTGRKFYISDSDASNTGSAVTVNGSQDYTLPLPATIKATLKGNADTATKATQDANGKVISTEYLHRVANSSSTLNQFSGAPAYLLGIESFANGGEVKWQAIADISVGNATTANTWKTARNFSISDDSAKNTGTTVSVNGGDNVVLPLPNQIYLTGNHAGFINGGETDKFFDFAYGANPTTSSGASWRIGALNSGSGDTNYFVIQTGGSTTSNTTWNNALRIGMNTLDIYVGGNLNPLVTNTKTLGTSDYKWKNVYATAFTGNLTGNADSATKWKDARKFSISDSDASHTGTQVSVDGSQDYVLPLPSTIKGTLEGNATTSTTASKVAVGASITTAANLDAFLEASKLKATLISTGVTYADGTLSGNDGEVISIGYSNTTYGNQIFFDPDTDKISVRRKSTSWKPWVDLIHTGNISSYSAGSSSKWATARKFSISDSDASNTGTQVSIDGSQDYVLPLPATIKATLKGNADSATVSRYLSCPDTRSAVIKPEDLTAAQGVQFNFKQKSVTGLTAAYAGVMSFRPYSSASDWSGGPAHEVAFDNNGIYHRKSTDSTTWGAWETIIHSGNISTYASGSADKWTTPRNFYIADADAANTGDAVSVDGSANVTLKLPSTIKATLTGNASSATKAYVTIADTTKFYLIGSTNTSSGNADLKEDTGLYAGTTKGQLGAAYVGINGDNTSYRLYVNGTSLFTGLVNINTSTGTLKIGSQNSSWTHFEAQRDFYFNRQASINGNFLPYTDLTYNLGADSYRWSNVYANVLRLQGAASDPSTSAGARIEFTYDNGTSRSQGVYISYSPNDSYRAPGGLKVMGASDLGGSAWFEVEGATYSNGIIYAKATTDSSSTSTGALVVTGGVGIAKQLRVGDNTNIAGTLGVTKATTLSSTLTVSGNTSLNGNLTVASNKTTTLGGTLTVSGIATFSNQIKVEKDTDSTRSLDGNASIVTDGGVSVAKQLSAKMIKIDNGQTSEGCQLIYNETNNCLEFVFS